MTRGGIPVAQDSKAGEETDGTQTLFLVRVDNILGFNYDHEEDRT